MLVTMTPAVGSKSHWSRGIGKTFKIEYTGSTITVIPQFKNPPSTSALCSKKEFWAYFKLLDQQLEFDFEKTIQD
jgi:hypothetical protein